jgi:nonspecific dipeptidase
MSNEDFNKRLFQYIDDHEKDYIERLSHAVSIPSVSAWPEHRPEVVRMVQWTKSLMESLGATVELADVGEQKLGDGTKLKLPDVILGTYGNDKTKKTVLIYGHLDVQPAQVSDGWDTEPFVLTEKHKKLYGRGSTDDKGPVLSWLNVIEAYQKLNEPFPVNVKFVLESMEECGSDGLEDLLKSLKNTFLSGIDYVVISDSYWLGKKKPCLQYGLRSARIISYFHWHFLFSYRGICYFFLDVECSTKDLHSGCFGGTM